MSDQYLQLVCRGILLIAFVILPYTVTEVEGIGCKDKCCKGRNNACRALGARMNSPRSRVCFCDENCLEMRDCCLDYHEACSPRKVHCEVGQWSEWGKCNKECGYGHQIRSRPVSQSEKHGGDPCPNLNEKRACFGNKCFNYHKTDLATEMKESAKIIPAKFGTWRASKVYDPYRGIRKNLFHHYKSNDIINRPSYCAKFEITKTRKNCAMHNRWGHVLALKGRTLCVECQPSAMDKHLERCNGHGVHLKETRWNALNIHNCHGLWVMKSKHQKCSCNPNSHLSFILV